MTLDELRKLCLLHAFSISSCPKINEAFSQYESENKKVSNCEPDTNYVMKFEIEEMKKEMSEQYAYTKKYIACIDECRAEIETLKKQAAELNNIVSDKFTSIDKKIESICIGEKTASKQERFVSHNYDGSGKFHIYDKKKEHFHDGLFSRNQAEETCRILNSLEAKK